MRVLLLGFALPDASYEALSIGDPVHTASSHRFSWALVNALTAAGVHVDLLSAAPISDYPHNRRLLVPGQTFPDGQALPFVNVLGLKHLTRYVSARWLSRDASPDAVVVHGLNSALLYAGIKVGRRHAVPVVAVMTDPPDVPHGNDNRVSLRAKRVDLRAVRRSLREVTGVVAVTDELAADFAPGRPCLIMDGIYQPLPEPKHTNRHTDIVYAGGLTTEQGVPDLLEAIGDRWTVTLYGSGPCAVPSRPNITQGGLLTAGEELSTAMAAARVLVIPRPLADRTYGFPSKLLEYLASGTPVVSTRVVPDEYAPFVHFTDAGPQGLRSGLEEVLAWPHDMASTFASRGREYVLSAKTAQAQGQRLAAFLAHLTEA